MSRQNDGFEFHHGLLQRLLNVVYRAINFFERWDRLPTLIGAVNLGVFRDRLRAHNLHHTGYGEGTSGDWGAGNERWRSPDGSFNSLDHPRVGMAGTRFGRNFECIFGRAATPLVNNGLLSVERGRIFLTDRGLEMADSVFAEFV